MGQALVEKSPTIEGTGTARVCKSLDVWGARLHD